jgi:hypothetical protein
VPCWINSVSGSAEVPCVSHGMSAALVVACVTLGDGDTGPVDDAAGPSSRPGRRMSTARCTSNRALSAARRPPR